LNKENDIFTSPLGAVCEHRNRAYQIPEDKTEIDSYTDNERARMHLNRTAVAFYITGLFFLFFCLFTGIAGCWRRGPGLILSTGILLLFATLFLAAAMAVWHGVDYLEREVITVLPYIKTWHPLLKLNTEMSYGWSYIISWIGIGFALISSILMLAAYQSIKEEEKDEYEKKRAPYLMPNYYADKAVAPYAAAGMGQYPFAYPAGPYYGNPYAYGNPYLTYGR